MIKKIKKRDGRIEKFNPKKIQNAISKAFISTEVECNNLSSLVNEVVRLVNERHKDMPTVEEVQDIIEEVLIMNQYVKVAKAFILYREERSKVRNQKSRLMKAYYDIAFSKSESSDMKRENANINSDTAMGAMLKYGSEGAKAFNALYILNPKHSKAHEEGLIHIHDLDFLTLTLTCCQIDLKKLFKGGFHTGHGAIREPQDIQTYTSLACIAIQANQNDQHGGQSIPNFDYDMAEGVKKTYKRLYKYNLKNILDFEKIELDLDKLLLEIEEKYNLVPQLNNQEINKYLEEKIDKKYLEYTENLTKQETIKRTYQAMESLIHNLNTMHSRAGAQVPFSSLNYGTDTSAEGRLVIEQLLKATIRGLGNGETPIFPIQIFKVKEGINYNPEDPNYDLFKLAIKASSKRLFPNFSFIDEHYNLSFYKKEDPHTEIAYMGCRTRVIQNIYDPNYQVVTGRGNLSFTSINLPRLALLNPKLDDFYQALDETMDLVIEQLLERFKIQSNLHIYNFPFLMGQGVWNGSEYLKADEKIGEIIKHGTMSMGFIGLAETLKILTGKHHGESSESQKLGLEIIERMRTRCDQESEKRKLNFTLLATPAEGLSGRFVVLDRKKFGVIEGVTNHDYYTNSFHIPVYYPISAYEKIDLEAPYHFLTNAGHISYVELDGDPSQNLAAFEKIIRYMKEKGVGYGSINHSVDFDPVCGYTGIINDRCPLCNREEGEIKFHRIRRITGYLVGTLDRFNDAKRKEVKERVKHA